MIKRGEPIRVGPLRVEVINVKQDDHAVTRCEVILVYGNIGLSSMSKWVDEPDLERLKDEVDLYSADECAPTVGLHPGLIIESYGGTDGDDEGCTGSSDPGK